MLADELGLEPGPELRRLQEAILAHDPAIATVPVDRRRRGNLRAVDLVRRTRGRARPGRGRSARAPPRDAHRRARRRQEPARRRGRAFPRGRVPGRHLARRLRAGGRRGRRRPPPRTRRRRSRLRSARARLHGFATQRLSSSSTRASTCSTRQRGSRRRSSRSVQARILATSREALHVARRGETPVAPLEAAAVELFLERAHDPDSSRTPRPSRSLPRLPGASTDCRWRSSSPPRA